MDFWEWTLARFPRFRRDLYVGLDYELAYWGLGLRAWWLGVQVELGPLIFGVGLSPNAYVEEGGEAWQ